MSEENKDEKIVRLEAERARLRKAVENWKSFAEIDHTQYEDQRKANMVGR